MNWRDDAACLTSDTDLFFPVGSNGPAMLQVEHAKQICAACPVRSRCLDWALKTPAEHGVWGGLSEDERRSLKRRISRSRTTTQPEDAPVTIRLPVSR